jgi:lipoprotein-releasing system permease protein
MRLFACLLAAQLCACDAGTKPSSGHSPPSHGLAAKHADPWAAGSGAALGSNWNEPIPGWIHDPPDVLRAKINGVNAHVVALKTVVEFSEYRDVLAVVEKTPGVTAAEPFIFLETNIASAKHGDTSVALKAVDPKRVSRVLDLPKHLTSGSIETLASDKPPSIILGDVLANKLEVKLGDDVTITPPGAVGSQWKPTKLRVTGTFHVDFDEYDERLGYISLPVGQAMAGRGDSVMGVEATVADLEQSGKIAETIEHALGGPPYKVMDWYELNKNLFTTLYGSRRP